MNDNRIFIPYTATGFTILARFLFMYLMYVKKSTNNISLCFCVMNICSSCLWIEYSIDIDNSPLLLRSEIDVALFAICALYIINNKWKECTKIQTDNSIV